MKLLGILFFLAISAFGFAQKPNVLVFFVDDMGYSELGCYNAKTDLQTPNINKLAQNGVLCTSGYVTAPQCSPSRAGIMTGYYQQRFGHEANPEQRDRNTFGLERSLRTLGDYMQSAGYQTGYVGKWDLGRKFEDNPEQRGFDFYYGAVVGARHYPPNNNGPLFNRVTRGYDSLVYEEFYYTHQLTVGAQEFIGANKQEPFFLFVAYTAPHSPFEATREAIAKNTHIQDEARRTYAGMVTALDGDIGKIMQQLHENGLEENTLVFFISDNGAPIHGPATGNNLPLRGNKGDLFEGGIRIPFIVQWKEGMLPRGTKYHRPVSSLDLLPTLLAVSDSDIPESLPGTNLIPYLKGEEKADPSGVLYWRWMGQRAVRAGNWKWVSHPKQEVVGLFNLEVDPEEKNNLLEKEPGKAAELEGLWNQWNRKNIQPLWRSPAQLDGMRKAYGNEGMEPGYLN